MLPDNMKEKLKSIPLEERRALIFEALKRTISPLKRPNSVDGITDRIKTGCGWLYITKSTPTEDYKEVFLRLGKAGGCPASFLDGIGRLITFALNAGVSEDTIVRAFAEIRCPSPMWSEGIQVLSCLDGIAKLMKTKSKKE